MFHSFIHSIHALDEIAQVRISTILAILLIFQHITFIYIFTGGNQFFVFVPFRRLDHLFLLRLKFYKKKINKRNQFPIYSQNAKMSIGDEIKNKDAQKMFLRIISLERFFLFLYLLLYYECTVHEHVRVHWKAKKSVLMCLCICVCVCRY